MNVPVNVELANVMLYLPLRLIRSAPGQKAEAKLVKSFHRERSQGRAAMRGHEVASLPGEAGLPLGQSQRRTSPFLVKSVLSALFSTGRVAAYAVSGAPLALVLQAITSCEWFVLPTDEVSRRPGFIRVSVGYKSHTKGQHDASATGTGFPRPRLKRCQQRQSRGARSRFGGLVCSERQNLRVPRGPGRFMGPVSPAVRATKWLGRTSSCQTAGSLRNSPQQPVSARAAVHPR